MVAVTVGPPHDAAGDGEAIETLTIPRVSPLRGSQPQGTMTVAIGASMGRGRTGPAAARPTAMARPAAGATAVSAAPAGADLMDVTPAPHVLPEPDSLAQIASDGSEEPPLPEEAGAAVTRSAGSSTVPLEAGPGQVLHVRFKAAPDDRIVAAFTELRTLIRERPGVTPVVLHIPAGAGRSREMRLGAGIAYDADLLADVERRFGGLLRLDLS
jgi:hypothetical protein